MNQGQQGIFSDLVDAIDQYEVRLSSFANGALVIPPGAANHRVDAEMTFVADAKLWSIAPHTHLRGKSFEYTLQYPDGRKEVILSVPRYDFEWQTEYEYTQPLRVPKGSRIVSSAWYDNTASNRFNPNPDIDVTSAITELKIGEALVSLLLPDGSPSPVDSWQPGAFAMAPFAPRAVHELTHPRHGRGAEDQIDVGRALLHGGLLELGHAAHDAQHEPGLARLERAQLAELGEDLVLGLLADGAGVDEDQIGVGFHVGELVAMLAQQGERLLQILTLVAAQRVQLMPAPDEQPHTKRERDQGDQRCVMRDA